MQLTLRKLAWVGIGLGLLSAFIALPPASVRSWVPSLLLGLLALLIGVFVYTRGEKRFGWYAVAAAFVWAAVAGSVIWPFNHKPHEHYSDGWLGVVGENGYVLILVALVALLPARSPAIAPVSPAVGAGRAAATA